MLFRLCIVALVTLVAASPLGVRPAMTGEPRPLYPDLIALPPENLFFAVEEIDGARHQVLKFSNVIVNRGPGRLELDLEGDRVDGDTVIYQNLYDDPRGGHLRERHQVGSGLLFHRSHDHYHLEDFNRFELLQAGEDGLYRATTGIGVKASSCVVDHNRVDERVDSARLYGQCDQYKQGLSTGWADIYYASFPEQWVDLGTKPLSDGHYALRSTVDPGNRIDEDNADTNNAGTIYFSVQEAALVGLPPPATCKISPTYGPMLQTTAITCTGFMAEEPVFVSWDSPESGAQLQFDAGPDGAGSGQLTVPDATGGGHKIVAQGRVSGRETGVIFAVTAALRPGLDLARPGTPLPFNLSGFGAREPLLLSWSVAGQESRPLGRAQTNELGAALALFPLPPDALGEITINARGSESGASAAATVQISADAPATPVASEEETPEPPPPVTPAATPVTGELLAAPRAGAINLTNDESTVSVEVGVSDAITVVVEYGVAAFDHAVRAEPSGEGHYRVTFTTLDPETTYRYRIVAVGEGGYTASSVATFTSGP